MSFCMNCGAKLNDGDAFCATCGSAVNSIPGVQNTNINNVKTIETGNKPLAIIAMVFAFIFPPLGLILAIAAVIVNRRTDCKTLSIVALVFAILWTALIGLSIGLVIHMINVIEAIENIHFDIPG